MLGRALLFVIMLFIPTAMSRLLPEVHLDLFMPRPMPSANFEITDARVWLRGDDGTVAVISAEMMQIGALDRKLFTTQRALIARGVRAELVRPAGFTLRVGRVEISDRTKEHRWYGPAFLMAPGAGEIPLDADTGTLSVRDGVLHLDGR